jgi:hypothetical protein
LFVARIVEKNRDIIMLKCKAIEITVTLKTIENISVIINQRLFMNFESQKSTPLVEENPDDYFNKCLERLGSENEQLYSFFTTLSDDERRELSLALNGEGLHFGAFNSREGEEAQTIAQLLSEWRESDGEQRKTLSGKVLDILNN